jgi:hypothetical protein
VLLLLTASHLLQVVVRCRPLNDKEQNDGRQRIVDVDARQGQILVGKLGWQPSLLQLTVLAASPACAEPLSLKQTQLQEPLKTQCHCLTAAAQPGKLGQGAAQDIHL